jgi:hypothetical protein
MQEKDWADRAAERFYLTHTKFCQGPNASTKTTGRWLRGLASKFRTLRTKRSVSPDVQKEIGNVLDHWEQLPNDFRSDPAFEALDAALQKLYKAVME